MLTLFPSRKKNPLRIQHLCLLKHSWHFQNQNGWSQRGGKKLGVCEWKQKTRGEKIPQNFILKTKIHHQNLKSYKIHREIQTSAYLLLKNKNSPAWPLSSARFFSLPLEIVTSQPLYSLSWKGPPGRGGPPQGQVRWGGPRLSWEGHSGNYVPCTLVPLSLIRIH